MKKYFNDQKGEYSTSQKLGLLLITLGVLYPYFLLITDLSGLNNSDFTPLFMPALILISILIISVKRIKIKHKEVMSILIVSTFFCTSYFYMKYEMFDLANLLVFVGLLLFFKRKIVFLIFMMTITVYSAEKVRELVGFLDLEYSIVHSIEIDCVEYSKLTDFFGICLDDLEYQNFGNNPIYRGRDDTSIVVIPSPFILSKVKDRFPKMFKNDKAVILGGIFSTKFQAEANTAIYFGENTVKIDTVYSYKKGNTEIIWGMNETMKQIFVLKNDSVVSEFLVKSNFPDIRLKFNQTMPIVPF